jgi:hypothetical protein
MAAQVVPCDSFANTTKNESSDDFPSRHCFATCHDSKSFSTIRPAAFRVFPSANCSAGCGFDFLRSRFTPHIAETQADF